MGDNAIGESTARKWFSRFKEDRFDISDTPYSGRLSGFDEDRLNTLIDNDSRQCTQELSNVMNCDHSTIVRHMHSMGKVKKIGFMCTARSKPAITSLMHPRASIPYPQAPSCKPDWKCVSSVVSGGSLVPEIT